MLARKCDRCGKFYDIENSTYDDFIQIVIGKDLRRNFVPPRIKELSIQDLCSDCVKDFLVWFGNTEEYSESTQTNKNWI